MKKTLAILSAIVMMVSTASAVSVSWSSAAVSFSDSGTLKNNANIMAYVVYLSSGNFAESYTVDSSFSAASVGSVVSSDTDGTAKSGKNAGVYSFALDSKTNGDTFGLVLSYNDGTDTYWNLSSTKNVLAGLVAGDASYAPSDWTDFAINGAKGTDPTLIAGGGWVKGISSTPSVPEPATGALALAGVALLFRRRKA